MNLRILVETMRTLDGVVGTIRSFRLRKKLYGGTPLVHLLIMDASIYRCVHFSSNPRPRERTKGVTKRMQWVLADVSRPNTSYSGTSEYRSRKRQHGSPPGG